MSEILFNSQFSFSPHNNPMRVLSLLWRQFRGQVTCSRSPSWFVTRPTFQSLPCILLWSPNTFRSDGQQSCLWPFWSQAWRYPPETCPDAPCSWTHSLLSLSGECLLIGFEFFVYLKNQILVGLQAAPDSGSLPCALAKGSCPRLGLSQKGLILDIHSSA